VDPKTKGSVRSLALPPELVPRFNAHRRAQKEMPVKKGALWANADLVFTDERGGPVTRLRVKRPVPHQEGRARRLASARTAPHLQHALRQG
jgi:hypothetical protein